MDVWQVGGGPARGPVASPSGRRAAKDPLFKKVAEHYLALPKTYAIWGDAQELKNTYQK